MPAQAIHIHPLYGTGGREQLAVVVAGSQLEPVADVEEEESGRRQQ